MPWQSSSRPQSEACFNNAVLEQVREERQSDPANCLVPVQHHKDAVAAAIMAQWEQKAMNDVQVSEQRRATGEITERDDEKNQWHAAFRANPRGMSKTWNKLLTEVNKYLDHKDLNASQRKQYHKDKQTLKQGECMVVMDFSSKVSPHNKNYTTMNEELRKDKLPNHVVTVYRVNDAGQKEVQYVHFLSEAWVKEAGGVYVYQCMRLLVKYEIIAPTTRYIKVWVDGCAKHYKVRTPRYEGL